MSIMHCRCKVDDTPVIATQKTVLAEEKDGRPNPNLGRLFYSCPNYRDRDNPGCKFFKWADAPAAPQATPKRKRDDDGGDGEQMQRTVARMASRVANIERMMADLHRQLYVPPANQDEIESP